MQQKPPRRHAESSTITESVQRYAALRDRLTGMTDRYVRLIETRLDDAGINYLSVAGRTKTVSSFAAKATRELDGQPLYPEPLRQITDQIGVRVITYVHSDVAAVADVLADALRIIDDRDLGQVTAAEGRWGYASRHVLVALDHDKVDDALAEEIGEQPASVQIRTVLQHAWAEFEHDIRYKGTVPDEFAPDLDRRFTLAAGLLELADREFSTIRDRLRGGEVAAGPADPEADPRIGAKDLANFLGRYYAEAGWSRTDHYAWISGLLLELGITSLDELVGLVNTIDAAAIDARMNYKYPPGAVRRLDDALLAVFGTRYIGLHGNAHRTELLTARLEKLRADPAG